MRRQLYRWGIFPIQRVDAVVIVVGNVIVGGAGKTPTVIELVRHLKQQGLQVGVITRGYGRNRATCLEVHPAADPASVGDEPLLLQHATQVPVIVGSQRAQAAHMLLDLHPATQVIVCDDGLQHYGLYRDLEVCVFDNRGLGNGWLLPAGPLREHWPTACVATAGQHPQRQLALHTGNKPAFAGFRAQRTLAPIALRRDGTTVGLESLREAVGKPWAAIAGIAQPEAFFGMLRQQGIPLAQTFALPDHYDFDSLPRNIYEGYSLICTEKDAAKLWQHAPDALAVPLIQTAEPAFYTTLDQRIAQLLNAKLSSPHGHPTT